MNDIVYASIVIGFASFSQSVTGVGFVMIATPFLLSVLNVKDTVLIALSTSLISQIIVVYRHWRVIHPQMFLNFVLGSALGAPIGLYLFSLASLTTLKLILGVSLFTISSFSVYKTCRSWNVMDASTTYRISPEAPLPWTKEVLLQGVSNRAGKLQLFVGTIAGFFGSSIGMPGIPLTVYYSAANVDKDVARSTTLSFFIVLISATLAANYGAGAISARVYDMFPLLIPALLVGMAAGNKVFPHLPQRWFQLILNSTILYSACKILIEYL